jgi:SIR2-like domain
MADEELIQDLQTQIERGQVVAVIGAGISIAATNGNKLVSWRGLLESGVDRCITVKPTLSDDWRTRILSELDSNDLDNLLWVATEVSTILGGPSGGEFRRWLRETVGGLRVRNRDAIEALRRLRVQLATTNYDGLIEEVTGLEPVTWRDGATVQRVIRADEEAVLHLHGHWNEPESIVLGAQSYAEVLGNAHAQNVLRALQTMKTLLFVGFGMGLKDPNFAPFLRWSGQLFASSEYRSFRLCKEAEVQLLQDEHPPEQRLFLLSCRSVESVVTSL